MKESRKLLKVFDFFKYLTLALIPILNIYSGILIINFGFAVLLALAILEILINRGSFSYNREFLIVMSVVIGLNIVTGFLHLQMLDIDSVMNNTFYMIVIALVGTYFMKPTVVDGDRFFKYLCVISVICTLYLFYQAIMYACGVVVYGYIPGLKVDKSVIEDVLSVPISYGRPSSFFSEPAHYAIFILPIYAMALNRRKFLLSVFLLAGLIVSTSSTGYLGLLVITAIFVAKEKKIPIIIKWILSILGIILIIQFIPVIGESGILEKFKFVNLVSNTRVFGTLQYFKYFGVKEILFGVGQNRLESYMSHYTAENIENYSCAVFFAFFSYGIFGGSFWTCYVARLHRLSRFKMIYIVFIIVYLSDQILFNRNLVYLLLLLYVFSDKDDGKIPAPETAMIDVAAEETPASGDSP